MLTNYNIKYLRKSIIIFRTYLVIFLITLFLILVIKDNIEIHEVILSAIISLGVISIALLAPIGLFFTYKSKKLKEDLSKKRILFFIGHSFFSSIVWILLITVVKDLIKYS